MLRKKFTTEDERITGNSETRLKRKSAKPGYYF